MTKGKGGRMASDWDTFRRQPAYGVILIAVLRKLRVLLLTYDSAVSNLGLHSVKGFVDEDVYRVTKKRVAVLEREARVLGLVVE